MNISTGYFAKAKAYSDNGYSLFSIARKRPWFLPPSLVLHEIKELAPTEYILSLKDRPEEYEEMYKAEVLERADINRILYNILVCAGRDGKDKAVLMCYEAPNKFCHRHIVAKWINESIGREVKEVDICLLNQ